MGLLSRYSCFHFTEKLPGTNVTSIDSSYPAPPRPKSSIIVAADNDAHGENFVIKLSSAGFYRSRFRYTIAARGFFSLTVSFPSRISMYLIKRFDVRTLTRNSLSNYLEIRSSPTFAARGPFLESATEPIRLAVNDSRPSYIHIYVLRC